MSQGTYGTIRPADITPEMWRYFTILHHLGVVLVILCYKIRPK
jgi:hypothetical protein